MRCSHCGDKLVVANVAERRRCGPDRPMLTRDWRPVPVEPRPDEGYVCKGCGTRFKVCLTFGTMKYRTRCACGQWWDAGEIPPHLEGNRIKVKW